jgi:hypothetical protein
MYANDEKEAIATIINTLQIKYDGFLVPVRIICLSYFKVSELTLGLLGKIGFILNFRLVRFAVVARLLMNVI